MPLIFPTSPIIGQTYQSGSSSTYQWNGSYWETIIPPTQVFVTATSASFASTGSSVNPLSQNVVVSGSFTVFTGSAIEFQVHDTGIKLGSTQLDRHTVTGSMFVSSSLTVSGSLNLSGSLILNVSGSITGSTINQPTVVFAYNTAGQSIPNSTPTTITNWTNVITQNAGEWNATTGTFTARKAAIYSVAFNLLYLQATGSVGNQFNVGISRNGIVQSTSVQYVQNAGSIFRPTGTAVGIVSLNVGDTITFTTFQDTGGPVGLTTGNTWLNNISIQQVASRIIH